MGAESETDLVCESCYELGAFGTDPLATLSGDRCEYCAQVYGAEWGLSYSYAEGTLAYRIAVDHATAPVRARHRQAVALVPLLAAVLRRAARAAWRRWWERGAVGELPGLDARGAR